MRALLSTFTLLNLLLVSSGAPLEATAPPHPGDPVRAWNRLALETVRLRNGSDAQAARLYAMVNGAVYDAVNGIASQQGALARRGHALVPVDGAPAWADPSAAAAAAAHAVLSREYPDLAPGLYDPRLALDLAASPPGWRTTTGRDWGAEVGAAVWTARQGDGSLPVESQPAGTGPGQFRASWSGVQFRNLAPFAIADPSEYFGSGPALLASLDYAGSLAEVAILGDASLADDAKLASFRFWSLGSGTSQPPGAWIEVALAVTGEHPMPLPKTARLFALLSLSMADTVAPTVMTKFVFRHWRPATAIREADTDDNPSTDSQPSWAPRAGGIGTSPEYWSGHSSFSGAAAAALAGFLCDDEIDFTLLTDSAPDGVARDYPSFSAAAAEAGRSRVLGGIHFEFSNQAGLAAGRAVAKEVLATKLLREHGPTHLGACPL